MSTSKVAFLCERCNRGAGAPEGLKVIHPRGRPPSDAAPRASSRMTCTVDASLAIGERLDPRHLIVRPAALQIAVASSSAPLTITFEMPGAAATTRFSDAGTSAGGRAEGGRPALSAVPAAGPVGTQLNIEINAIQIMVW